jgi:glucokinase
VGCKMKGKLYMGLDIGGSKISAALVDIRGQMSLLRRQSTPPDGKLAQELLIEMGQSLLDQTAVSPATVVGVGIGFGGPVDYRNQRIRGSHHTEGWEVNLPLAQEVGEALGLPVRLDNDANTAGLGEALFGAGKGKERVLYINVGTGIGGALVRNQQVYHGAHCHAGEIGHMILQKDGPLCACGHHGCLEPLASGTAMGQAAVRALDENPKLDTRLKDYPREEISGVLVSDLALEGDELSRSIIAQAADWLGLAAANACNVWDPDAVIIGGGVSGAGDTLMEPFCRAFRGYAAPPANEKTDLYLAKLGYDAGVVGAAALALTTM